MDKNYKSVTDIEELKHYIGDARVVSFDYETAADKGHRSEEKAALDPHKAHITECSYSVQEGTGVSVPLRHLIGKNMDWDDWLSFHKELLESHKVVKVCHNIAFESAFSYHLGIVIQAPVYDTICAAQMTQNGDYSFRRLKDSGLKTLSEELLGYKRKTFTETTDGKPFDELDPQNPETIAYACEDADQALQLMRIFNDWFDKYLPRHRWIVEHLESPTAVYLGIMKHNGAPLDIPLMEEKKKEAERHGEASSENCFSDRRCEHWKQLQYEGL
jgi:DNA polymerase-1